MPSLMTEEELKKQLTPDVPSLNPVVKEYLVNKYPERFAGLQADREVTAKKYDLENGAPGAGGNLLMGLVAALKDDKSYADVARDERLQREAERENALKPFDEKIKAAKEAQEEERGAFDFGRKQTLAGREDAQFAKTEKDLLDAKDPNSSRSMSARQTVTTFAPKMAPLVEGKSSEEIERMMPWIKNKMDQDFKASEAEKDREVKREIIQTKNKVAESKPTKAQETVDKEFGKEYNDYVVKGGYGMVRSQLANLKNAIHTLETDKSISGPVRGALPDWARSVTNPTAVNVKEQIAAIVQNSLRPILGAQFTEKEGENLIKRTYNDRLPPETNARRAKLLLKQIQAMADQKLQAANYYEENGTLQGFKGKVPSMESLNDLDFDSKGKPKVSESDIDKMSKEELEAYLNE